MNSVIFRLMTTIFLFLAVAFCPKNLAFARKIMVLPESGGAAAPNPSGSYTYAESAALWFLHVQCTLLHLQPCSSSVHGNVLQVNTYRLMLSDFSSGFQDGGIIIQYVVYGFNLQYVTVVMCCMLLTVWLQPVPGNPLKAFCCCCKVKLMAKVSVLRQHARTTRHIENQNADHGMTLEPTATGA